MNNPISFLDENGKEVIVNMQGDIISNDGKDNRVTLDLGGKNLYLPIGELGGKIDIGIIYPNKISANIEEAENSGLWEFKTKVSNGSKWDLKMNKNTIYGLGNGNTTFLFEGQEMESQDVGNHFFGIMGKATGMFSDKELLMGAGIYQMYSGTSKSEWQKYKPQTVMIMDASGYMSKMTVGVLSAPYGDDPRDQSWIREGIKYFNIHF